MIRAYPLTFLLLLIYSPALIADTTIVDKVRNYSIYLPDNWVRNITSDSQDYFVDTTYRYPALLSLTKYAIDTTMYASCGASCEAWTGAYFTAYKLSVEYSVDPEGVVLYSSNDSTVRQGSLPAAEAYSVFFSYDTSIGAWAEYIRFTACNRSGYELDAIGDTDDMSANIGYYAAILQSIRFLSASRVMTPFAFRGAAGRIQAAMTPYVYDPLGRKLRAKSDPRFLSSGIFFRNKRPASFYIR
jgi:hypothetical protein